MNAAAKLHRTRDAVIPLDRVLGVGGFNLGRAMEVDPQFLEPEYPFEWGGVYELPAGTAELVVNEGPDPAMDIALIPVRSTADAHLVAAREAAVLLFSDWETVLKPGDTILPGAALQRLMFPTFPAGFPVRIDRAGLYALFTQHHPDEFNCALRRAGEALAPQWSNVFKPDHEHDDEVASVGITTPGDLDGTRLNEWISTLLRNKGNDIFRMKGVLAVRGAKRRLVFQGVHMLFDARLDREWQPGELRANTLIFIGRNLDRAALNAGFQACLA
jgi:hypothetical protein